MDSELNTKVKTYSLITVDKEYNGFVDGTWIQDHTGTLETAIKAAKETEKANNNKVTIAVVDSLLICYPNYMPRFGLERLG